MFKACVVIPVFDHEHAIADVVAGVRAHDMVCILVDDGSSPGCGQYLKVIAQTDPEHIKLVRLAINSGKGAAVIAGFHAAAQAGFTHVLQIDADGQHCTEDIPQFLALAEANSESVIVGCPIFDHSVPKVRLYARYLTHVWVWINTLSFDINDSMCGFRVYPINAVMQLIARQTIGTRMNFDTDILVRLYWDGVRVINQPTRVTYPADGVSHFRVWLDNVLITRMHTVLFFGMLVRLPSLLMRKSRQK